MTFSEWFSQQREPITRALLAKCWNQAVIRCLTEAEMTLHWRTPKRPEGPTGELVTTATGERTDGERERMERLVRSMREALTNEHP